MTQTAAQLSTNAQAEISEGLNQSLAETTVATMLAQNLHWNVKGMHFGTLHALFQEIYEDHFAAQDDLAERIKALNGHADGVLARMLERSAVAEMPDSATANEVAMLTALLTAETTLAETLAGAGAKAAELGDTLTEDLCIARGQTHEKFAWMLRSHLA